MWIIAFGLEHIVLAMTYEVLIQCVTKVTTRSVILLDSQLFRKLCMAMCICLTIKLNGSNCLECQSQILT
jgi:hypothetical protein